MVGRTVPLRSVQSFSLADVLVPAGTDPWPESIAANRFGPGRDRVALTRVDPTVVAEVSVDAAQQGGCGVIRCDSSVTGRSCIRQTYLSFLILEPP